ncbi:MAG TPA: hypothetical protein VMZ26_10395 [Pyrinomonadaceae bacterium]|nr:hypothetical protein [Pyrinomonadaceae bacterium]
MVKIDLGKLPVVTIEMGTGSRRNLSFFRSIAGIDKLTDRITHLEALNGRNNVALKRLSDGEYISDSDFDTVSYQLDVSPMKPRGSSAHVSWFAKDIGILTGADMLPQLPKGNLFVSFSNTPASSEIFSFEKKETDGRFKVDDPENVVFYIGSGWRRRKIFRYEESAQSIISGQWQFTDDEATAMIGDILIEYQKLFGEPEPPPNVQIGIAKFSVPADLGVWEAEARGRSVTIISSDMPFRTQSLQRLHEQLRHEMFHLWIPNRMNLTGNYDWFYEGFALYESLKLAVRMNRIRFEDFLDTLSRAHTIDSAQTIQRTSLIQMSSNRFARAGTQIYARGMLVAFLCDLALLEQSKGKRSVEDLLRELFAKHRKPALPDDGNAAVLNLLKSNPRAIPVVEKYIQGAEKLEWESELNGAGIEDGDAGPLTNLRVKEKLNGRQKALLDKLGYNNWRKLTLTSK